MRGTVLIVAVLAALPTLARSQTVAIDGLGDTVPETVYQQEFATFSQATPSVLFNYQPSTTAVTTFLTDTAYSYAAAEVPLTAPQQQSYGRGAVNKALIQIPMFGVGVALPYTNAALGTHKLRLTDSQICGVLSGTITDWSQISHSSGTIAVIYRADADASTYILSRHLSVACHSSNSGFGSYPVPVTSSFAQMFHDGVPPANFRGVSGASATAAALLATPLSFGYLTPDYTSVAPASPNTTSLLDAVVINSTSGIGYAPASKDIAVGLKSPSPESTNIDPPSSQSLAAEPTNWVPYVPDTTKGYPIVGYSDWLLVTCNGSHTLDQDLIGFLTDHYTVASYATLRTNNGAVSVTPAFATAVKSIILSNKKKYGLNIGNPKVCPEG